MNEPVESPATNRPRPDRRGDQLPPGWRIPWWAGLVVGASNIYRRLLAIALGLMGPARAYALTGRLARWLYRNVDVLHRRSRGQCAAALGERLPPEQIEAVAEQAFVHRVWNLTDLLLADRLIHRGTVARYGGRLPEEGLARLIEAQRRRQPIIFVTAYYGPFDLLPLFLGYNGLQVGVVYRRHPNPGFDAYRTRIRGRSGCELIPAEKAARRLEEILAAGGSVAILADHHSDRRGMPTTFLGLPTRAMRTVGLLAWRYRADVVVAGIRRVNNAFQFELPLADVIRPADWAAEDDPVAWITRRYMQALEKMILEDPGQYLWAHARWGRDVVDSPATLPDHPP